jgi:RNA recognition motif-containing protein
VNIYVGNLPYKTGDQELRELFSQHGEVSSARVISDRDTGRSKGFGFVEMPDDSAASAAIEAIHEQEFMGRNLRVNEAQPKPPRDGARH